MRTAVGSILQSKNRDAFAAATVPIYWGAPDVKQEFNPAAFFCARMITRDTAALIAAIDEIDRDDESSLAMCHAPILAPDGSPRAARYVTDEACAEFLTGSIFEKGRTLRRKLQLLGFYL